MKRVFVILLLIGHGFYLGILPQYKTQIIGNNKAPVFINPYDCIKEAKSLLREGDIIMRLNTDPSSQLIRNFNRRDKKYSHSGIVLFENGHPYVFHISNGRQKAETKIRKDSLERFCNPMGNSSFGIFRYDFSSKELKNLKTVVHKWRSNGVSFDDRFDLATNTKMYCSEMVAKAAEAATQGRIHINPTKLTRLELTVLSAYTKHSFGQTEIIAIDDLYEQPSCKTVKEYIYWKN